MPSQGISMPATPRALIDQVRQTNARKLPSDPRLSVAEVAFLLGGSGESSFRRAFRRWSAAPPRQLRGSR